MMVDHVTYQVVFGSLNNPYLDEFFKLIGMSEADPSGDILEAGWKVRWYQGDHWRDTLVHLVEAEEGQPELPLGLSHFCVHGVGPQAFEECRRSRWLEHDGDSGRVWLKFAPLGLRVEVRP